MNKTVIFDLDGTLVDIAPLFLRIANELADRFKLKPITPDEIAKLKDLPLRKFFFERLGWRLYLLPGLLREGRARYHAAVPEVALFPGIPELIASLRTEGQRIGIVSSSQPETVRSILKRFDITVDFFYHSTLFGKARVLKKALQEQSAASGDVLYVGDEVRDVEACRKAGIRIIAVTWGLNSKAALERAGAETVDTREKLLTALLSRKEM